MIGARRRCSTRTPSARIDHRLVGAAVAVGAPVVPAAMAISPMSASARIERRVRGAPAAPSPWTAVELELAERVAERPHPALLDEFGGPRTGTPLDWLRLGGVAGT